MNLFDVEVSEADIKRANRLRAQVRARFPSPIEMFEDMARRDPGAFALMQHYFKEASAQDKDTALLMMVEACASTWALVREIRTEVRSKEVLN